MAKSTINKIIPILIQNVLISLGLAIILQFFWEYLNQPYIDFSSPSSPQQMDINIDGLIKLLLIEIFTIWLIIFILLSFLLLIYSMFAKAKNADLD